MKTSQVYVCAGAALVLCGLIEEKFETNADSAQRSQRYLSDRLLRMERIVAASHRESCSIWRDGDHECDCKAAS